MIVLQVSTIYREGMLRQPPDVDGGAPRADDAMHIDTGASAAASTSEGDDGQDDPPQILGQLLEGGVSPVELARLAQSGRRQRLGAHSHIQFSSCPLLCQRVIMLGCCLLTSDTYVSTRGRTPITWTGRE
jgi:hypothetical protein